MQSKQFGEWRAVRDLVESGRSAGSGDGRKERARRQRRPQRAERRRAVALQVRQIGQGFDIAHQGGQPADALFERARRLVGRLGRPAVERAHRRGLFAGHVSGLHHPDVDGDPAECLGVEFAQCGFDAASRVRVRHVNVGALGFDDRRGQPQSVQNHVRPVPQQPAVLDRSRFSLFTIGDDGGASGTRDQAPVVANRTQLHRERKGGTAAAEQSAGFDFGQQLVDTGQRAIAAECAIRREILAGLAGMLAQHPGFASGRGADLDDRGLCGFHWLFRHR